MKMNGSSWDIVPLLTYCSYGHGNFVAASITRRDTMEKSLDPLCFAIPEVRRFAKECTLTAAKIASCGSAPCVTVTLRIAAWWNSGVSWRVVEWDRTVVELAMLP